MRTLQLLTVILSLQLLPFSLQAKEAVDYWQKIGLKMSHLTPLLTPKNCLENETKFVACVGVIRVGVALTSKNPEGRLNALILPNEPLSEQGSDPQLIAEFGSLKVIKMAVLPETKIPLAQANTKRMQVLQKRQALTLDLYKNSSASPDFGGALNWLSQNIPFDGRESAVVAGLLNVYLSITQDPHTSIRSLEEIMALSEQRGENFSGLGMTLSWVNDQIVVSSLVEGGPALNAGFRPKDVLIGVRQEGGEWQTLIGVPIENAVEKIRGPTGSPVSLRVLRENRELELSAVRQVVSLPNVEYKRLEDRTVPFGYIRLRGFNSEESCADLAKALLLAHADQAKGLILDLRDNGGGLLDQAQCIAGLFVPDDAIVVTRRDLKTGEIVATEMVEPLLTLDFSLGVPRAVVFPPDLETPLVVLINSRSASASEIIAGVLQDYQRAVVVGETSFGKGTVQTVVWDNPRKPLAQSVVPLPLPQDIAGQLAYAHTTERFHLPSGRSNQIVGVVPDLEAYSTPDPSEDGKFAWREADIYLNSLPAPSGNWVQPRPDEINALKTCVEKTGQARATYEQHKNDAIPKNYEVLTAEDALLCLQNREASEQGPAHF